MRALSATTWISSWFMSSSELTGSTESERTPTHAFLRHIHQPGKFACKLHRQFVVHLRHQYNSLSELYLIFETFIRLDKIHRPKSPVPLPVETFGCPAPGTTVLNYTSLWFLLIPDQKTPQSSLKRRCSLLQSRFPCVLFTKCWGQQLIWGHRGVISLSSSSPPRYTFLLQAGQNSGRPDPII